MAVSVDMFMREGQRFEIVGDGELRALWIRSADGFVEATLHFGFAEGRPSLSLAVDQLDALIIASTMLRNRIAASIGAGLTEYRPTAELDGPDDPTDEPTDEPATGSAELCGAAGGFDCEHYRCTRELGHDGQHEDWSTAAPTTYQWHDWSVPVAVLPGVE